MPNNTIYIDNNATTPLLPEIVQAIAKTAASNLGNASSSHSLGDETRALIQRSREQVAQLVGAQSEDVFFTGSGSEANDWAIQSAIHGIQAPTIITCGLEHASVLNTCEYLEKNGATIRHANVHPSGLIDLDHLASLIQAGADLVTLQWVNNETGVIQPIEQIAERCQAAGVMMHTDAAQAAGKIPVDLATLPCDYLTLTGHKIHAPAGIAAIIAHREKLVRRSYGEGSDEEFRVGTENILGIVALGIAAQLRFERLAVILEEMRSYRDTFERYILNAIPEAVINGDTSSRVTNTTNIRFPSIDGQALVARLDQAGVICSQSSACTSQKPEPSHVLRAMHLSEDEAYASVRFSFAETNNLEETVLASDLVVRLCQDQWRFFGGPPSHTTKKAG